MNFSADGTNEVTVALNFDPMVSVTLICSATTLLLTLFLNKM